MGVVRRGPHIQDGRRYRLRRYVWSVLIMAEAANLADWISTLIGVGGLGKPELNPVAAALMRSFGVLWGTNLFKAMVALELAGIAGAALLLADRKARTGVAWSWVLLSPRARGIGPLHHHRLQSTDDPACLLLTTP